MSAVAGSSPDKKEQDYDRYYQRAASQSSKNSNSATINTIHRAGTTATSIEVAATLNCLPNLNNVQLFRRRYMQAIGTSLYQDPFAAISYSDPLYRGELVSSFHRIKQFSKLYSLKYEQSDYHIKVIREDDRDCIIDIDNHYHFFANKINGYYEESRSAYRIYHTLINKIMDVQRQKLCQEIFGSDSNRPCCCR